MRGGKREEIRVDNPVDCPDTDKVEHWREAIMNVTIMAPAEYLKAIKGLCQDKRGIIK
jgi:GTP-binding protein LepA